MVGFGERILLPLLEEFSALYPQVVLDISLNDELSTLGRDDVDIAIRGGYAPHQRVQAVRLMDNEFILLGAPSYLAKNGTPKRPQELAQHKGLIYRTPVGPQSRFYHDDDQWRTATITETAISNNGKWLANKAVNGESQMMAPVGP
jgi:DNA-binding transcriptional LysR family regulator